MPQADYNRDSRYGAEFNRLLGDLALSSLNVFDICNESYPYLNEPCFVFRTMAMIKRTSTCPIVYEVMDDLKKSLGFSRGRR